MGLVVFGFLFRILFFCLSFFGLCFLSCGLIVGFVCVGVFVFVVVYGVYGSYGVVCFPL